MTPPPPEKIRKQLNSSSKNKCSIETPYVTYAPPHLKPYMDGMHSCLKVTGNLKGGFSDCLKFVESLKIIWDLLMACRKDSLAGENKSWNRAYFMHIHVNVTGLAYM